MPYITQYTRANINNELADSGDKWCPSSAGDLNFVISQMINKFLKIHGLNYANVNEMVGALECCKLELYRRVAAPYEDIKCKENGDVYEV